MNNRDMPRYLGQQNVVRRVVVNRMPRHQLPLQQPAVPTGYTYQLASFPPPQLINPQQSVVSYQRPRYIQSVSMRPPPQQFVTPSRAVAVPQVSVTVGPTESDYLQYTDPVIDDFQYNQQQILSVDNSNYAQYEEQTYQHQSQSYPQPQPMQVQVQLLQQLVHAQPVRGAVRLQQQRSQETFQQVIQPSPVFIDPEYQGYNQVADSQFGIQRQQQQNTLAIEPGPSAPAPVAAQIQHQQQPLALQVAPSAPVAPVIQHQQQIVALPQGMQEQSTDGVQQIQIVITDPESENGAVRTSTPKSNETYNVNLIVDDVQNEVTVKNEKDTIDKDISRLANEIDLKLNDDDDDDYGDLDQDQDLDSDPHKKKVGRLSDEDVLKLPIQYLKPDDLERRKKLQHCKRQQRYLKNLVEKKGEKYACSVITSLIFNK